MTPNPLDLQTGTCDVREAIEWAKQQALFYSIEQNDKLLDEKNHRVSNYLQTLIQAAQLPAPEVVTVEEIKLRLRPYVLGVMGTDMDIIALVLKDNFPSGLIIKETNND